MNTTILFSTLILVQNDEDICHNIMQEPIVNLSHLQSQSPIVPPHLIKKEEHVSEENDYFNVPDDDEFEQIRFFQTFVEPILAASFLDDEIDLDDEIVVALATIKYYKMINRKLNALVRRVDSYFPTNFQNLMITHENTLKTIIGESKRLFDAQDKFIDEATLKVQTVLLTSNNALSKLDSI